MQCAGSHPQSVTDIEISCQRRSGVGNALKFKARAPIFMSDMSGPEIILGPEAESLDRTEPDIARDFHEVLILSVAEHQSIGGHGLDEMAEGFFDGGEVFKDIRVVELQIVQESYLGAVVDKLTALIKKGRVVFIPLDNKPGAISKTGTLTQIRRYSTD